MPRAILSQGAKLGCNSPLLKAARMLSSRSSKSLGESCWSMWRTREKRWVQQVGQLSKATGGLGLAGDVLARRELTSWYYGLLFVVLP